MITNVGVRKLRDQVAQLENLSGPQGALQVAEMISLLKDGLQEQRARILADVHYMNGTSMRDIAKTQDVSVNAVSLWLRDYGPEKYVTVRRQGDEFVVEAVPPRAVRGLMAAGRRVAPAAWGLYDNELGITDFGSAEELWHRLASQAE